MKYLFILLLFGFSLGKKDDLNKVFYSDVQVYYTVFISGETDAGQVGAKFKFVRTDTTLRRWRDKGDGWKQESTLKLFSETADFIYGSDGSILFINRKYGAVDTISPYDTIKCHIRFDRLNHICQINTDDTDKIGAGTQIDYCNIKQP